VEDLNGVRRSSIENLSRVCSEVRPKSRDDHAQGNRTFLHHQIVLHRMCRVAGVRRYCPLRLHVLGTR